MKRALMIAYHFPPLAGSSGIQRTLRFVQYLPQLGWQPLVLSAHPRAYERVNDDLVADIPAGTVVRRAMAFDTARHLSIVGRYIGAMARPDRWVSWKYDAVRQGMQLIREYRPDVIWSTYPIATAHLIGAELCRRSGLPWIADFRDPMAQDGYPADPITWKQYQGIEAYALGNAARSIFTTPGAARVYAERYPQAASRISVLENGYDEDSFSAVEQECGSSVRQPLHPSALTLLHSGIVYPHERDPAQFFAALRILADQGRLKPTDLQVRFRASVHEEFLHALARMNGVDAFIETCPPIDYKAALKEMLHADALLVMQASNCNEQIPGKIYEYLRAQRPILCLADPVGDTVGLMHAAGVTTTVRLDSIADIVETLPAFVHRLREGNAPLPDSDFVMSASRRHRSAALACLFEEAVGEHSRERAATA